MFEGIEGLALQWILDGIILSVVFGFAAGNYACSLVFRLPRGRLILDKKPYCGTCGTLLQVKDLFPVISAVMLKHKCRYCGTPFPVSHTWTEVLVGILFVLAFFKFNFSEQYVLVTFLGTFFITLAAIEANEKMIIDSVLISALISGLLFRTLQDHTIFESIQAMLVVLVIGCVLFKSKIKQVGHIFVPPKHVLLATVGAGCVGLQNVPAYFVLMLAVYGADLLIRKAMGNKNPPLLSVTIGTAATLLVLYPDMLGF